MLLTARVLLACVGLTLLTAARSLAAEGETPTPPTTYEVVINGESFRVEGDRLTKVQSPRKPEARYELVVRIAPTQVLRLNTVRLEYDMPADVFDDRGHQQRTVEIRHQLGFSVLLTDLGGPLDAKEQEAVMKARIDSVVKLHHDAAPKVSDAYAAKFAGAVGQGKTVRYTDAREKGHTCLVYVLGEGKFSVACIVQFLDDNKKEVLTPVKKVLDSIAALP